MNMDIKYQLLTSHASHMVNATISDVQPRTLPCFYSAQPFVWFWDTFGDDSNRSGAISLFIADLSPKLYSLFVAVLSPKCRQIVHT